MAGGSPDEPSHRHLLLALGDRRRLCDPGARGGHHPRRGRAPQVAGGRVHPHGHRRRGGDLPRRDARDRSPAPARPPPGRPPGERQLLLRAHGGIRRGLLRDRAPHHVVGAKPRGASHRVARRGRDPAARRAGADVPRDAPPDRRDRGPPRRHRVPDRRPDRRPGRGSRCTGERAREPDRRHRARRQEHRGRPSRASPHARPPRRHATRSGPRCRRAARRRSRSGACSRQGADHFFVWGGDGMAQRCIDTLAGTGTTVAIVPAGTANLLAIQPGHPEGHRGSGRHRARRDASGRSTSRA